MDTNKKILTHKLLEIILFLTLFVWAISLLAENILPGFISEHLSFLKLTIFASVIMVLSSFLGRQLGLSYEIKIKKWLLIILTILSLFVVSLSLIKFQILEIVIITVTSLLIGFYFYKVLFEK